MEFKEALQELAKTKRISFLDENFDKSLLVLLYELCKCENGLAEISQYEFILECEPSFGRELVLAYLESKREKDISYSRLAVKVEELSSSLESYGISCYIYSYFISAYFSLFESFFEDEDFKKLGVKEVSFQSPEEYDYQTLLSGEKTFGYGRLLDTKNDFAMLGTTLKRYKGRSAYVIIPKGTKTIGGWAFRGNKNVKFVYIPSTVTSIKSLSFYGCKSLKEVHLSENVQTLLPYTFEGCTNLEKINLERVDTIGVYCFKDCVLLKKESEGQ